MSVLDYLSFLVRGGTRQDHTGDPGEGETGVTVERHHPDGDGRTITAEGGRFADGQSSSTLSATNGPSESESNNRTDRKQEEDVSRGAEPASLSSVTGIGPRYRDRLADADVKTLSDLARADPETIARETGLSPHRVRRWIERARERN